MDDEAIGLADLVIDGSDGPKNPFSEELDLTDLSQAFDALSIRDGIVPFRWSLCAISLLLLYFYPIMYHAFVYMALLYAITWLLHRWMHRAPYMTKRQTQIHKAAKRQIFLE